MAKGRGRLSAIDLLPEECDAIVSWAAQALANNDSTQVDIYAVFKTKLIALQGEQGIDFDIPSFSSFNRYSVRLATLSKRFEHSREMAAALAERRDPASSDDMTLIAAEAIKVLVLETVEMSEQGKLSPKMAMELATALKSAAAAQVASTNRRAKLEAEEKVRRVEAEMRKSAEAALDSLENDPGISKEAVKRAREEFLGVRPKKVKAV